MKAAIAAEVARKELADDIKRGPGGIREIEFLAQALQLIRGGREPALRERRLLPALQALVDARPHRRRYRRSRWPTRIASCAGSRTACRCCAMRRPMRCRRTRWIARAWRGDSDYPDWDALRAALDEQRARVTAEFEALLAPRRRSRAASDLAAYWRALPEAGAADALAAAGFDDSEDLDGSLRDFARAPGVRALSDATRARLDRVLPALLEAAAQSSQPDAALRRLLPLLHTLLRRASYLALLDEQPGALARLVDVLARSALLAERLARIRCCSTNCSTCASPVPLPDRATLAAQCAQALHEDDAEAALHAAQRTAPGAEFPHRAGDAGCAAVCAGQRAATGVAGRRGGARWCCRWRGASCNARMAPSQARASRCSATAASAARSSASGPTSTWCSSTTPRPMRSPTARARWTRRAGSRAWRRSSSTLLGTVTGAGRLYDVDVRLRPDGAKGLLVSSLASFTDYQRERAWTWEHQALVRARGVRAMPALARRLRARARRDAGAVARCRDACAAKSSQCAGRMRAELDRTDAARFDLKQGEGGLVDLEFLLQFLVLRDARASGLAGPARYARPVARGAARPAPSVPATCERLMAAHAALLDAGLRCTLDRRPRIAAETRGDRRGARSDPRRLRGATASIFRSVRVQARRYGDAATSRACTSAATRAVSRNGSTGKGRVRRPADAMRPRASRASLNRRSRPRVHVGAEHEHRHRGRARFAEHVHRIGRADDAVGPRQQARVRIVAVVVAPRPYGRTSACPASSRSAARNGVHQVAGRAPRGRRPAGCRLRRAAARPVARSAWRMRSSKPACALGPPSNNVVRGCGSCASTAKSSRACASHASSTGCRLPSRAMTLSPRRSSCSGAITRSQCRGSMRGSRICTTRAPRSRSKRVASAAWRPQPIASAGGVGQRVRTRGRRHAAHPGNVRGASQRQGACGARSTCAGCIAQRGASAAAWRTLPACPSLSIQPRRSVCQRDRRSGALLRAVGWLVP